MKALFHKGVTLLYWARLNCSDGLTCKVCKGSYMERVRHNSADSWEARQASLSHYFLEAAKAYSASHIDEVSLRPHQRLVIRELSEAFAESPDHEFGRRMLVPLPPNSGKSFLTVLAMKMAGIGNVNENGQQLGGLIITERRPAVSKLLETCRRLMPEVEVAQYKKKKGETIGLDTPLTVATYRSIIAAEEDDLMRLFQERDLVGIDEAHRAIGPEIASRILKICGIYRPTLLASSATPQFDVRHTVTEKLQIPRTLSTFSMREAIEMGVANEAQLFALHTGESIAFNSKRDSITAEDMSPLIEREGRNKLIVNCIQDMAANCIKRGIAQCVAGTDQEGLGSHHARKIAEIAAAREIIDPETGKKRNLIVKAVGRFQSTKANMQVLTELDEGKVDCVTFTKYLTEAYDAPNGLGYILYGAPLGSQVDAEQFTGRGGRFHDHPTIYLVLVDQYTARAAKRVYTPFDVLGEDAVYQGKVIARQGPPLFNRTLTGAGQPNPGFFVPRYSSPPELHFSESILKAMEAIPPGTILDNVLIQREVYDEPPEGYVPLRSLPAVLNGQFTMEGIALNLKGQADSQGRPLLILAKHDGRITRYALRDEANAIMETRVRSQGTFTRMEITNFLQKQGWPRLSFDGFRHLCEEASVQFKPQGKEYILDADETQKVFNLLRRTPFVDPEAELAVSSLAAAFNMGSSPMMRYMKHPERVEYYQQHLRQRRRGLPPVTFKCVEALSLEACHKLLEEMTAAHSRMKLPNDQSIDEVISSVQAAVRESYSTRGIKPTLTTRAIAALVNRPRDPDVPYVLSEYGPEWRAHAACLAHDGNIFFPPWKSGQLEEARAICQGCAVQGDCLVDAYHTKSMGLAAGLTPDDRKALNEPTLAWLKKNRGEV